MCILNFWRSHLDIASKPLEYLCSCSLVFMTWAWALVCMVRRVYVHWEDGGCAVLGEGSSLVLSLRAGGVYYTKYSVFFSRADPNKHTPKTANTKHKCVVRVGRTQLSASSPAVVAEQKAEARVLNERRPEKFCFLSFLKERCSG